MVGLCVDPFTPRRLFFLSKGVVFCLLFGTLLNIFLPFFWRKILWVVFLLFLTLSKYYCFLFKPLLLFFLFIAFLIWMLFFGRFYFNSLDHFWSHLVPLWIFIILLLVLFVAADQIIDGFNSTGETIDFIGYWYSKSFFNFALELLDGPFTICLWDLITVNLRLGLRWLALESFNMVDVLLAMAIGC